MALLKAPKMQDPSVLLPRDTTGSYLHLKLKRFPSVEALTMPYAKKTWREHPDDVEVEYASTGRSICRQCHQPIAKDDLRVRLWLQCHKGCKQSAYFHGKDCLWKYPETKKIEKLSEFAGLSKLKKADQGYQVRSTFLPHTRRDDFGAYYGSNCDI